MSNWNDATLLLLTRLGRVRAFEVAAELGIGMKAAQQILGVLHTRNTIRPEGDSGWYVRQEVQSNDPVYEEKQSLDVESLLAQIKRLKAAEKTVMAQREEWKARALAAEAAIRCNTAPISNDSRFRELKRLIAKEFHPDNCKVSGSEQKLREDLFKTFWSMVENIQERPS